MPASSKLLAPAEMFSNVSKLGWSRTPMKYRRFDSLALAVKFAVEDAGSNPLRIVIRTDDAEFSGAEIRKIYDDASFPLLRKVGKV